MARQFLHYTIKEKLGEGARSVIYHALDPTTGREYALKYVKRRQPKDFRFIEQMESEYEISRNFEHPNLRKTFEFKIHRDLFFRATEAYLLMELFEGKSLDVDCPRGMDVLVDIFLQVAQAMKAMHLLGYVHCDLKPNNVLRSSTGQVKVIDYGQSCRIGTIKERIQGTPDYIAPEQVNRKPVTVYTDVFNFGATLYWVLTGKAIPTLYTVNRKGDNSFLMDERIDTPMELNPKVPVGLSKLIMECIATNPRRRPADMDEIFARLELARHVVQRPEVPIKPPDV
jgi:serine/threonine protein kinase